MRSSSARSSLFCHSCLSVALMFDTRYFNSSTFSASVTPVSFSFTHMYFLLLLTLVPLLSFLHHGSTQTLNLDSFLCLDYISQLSHFTSKGLPLTSKLLLFFPSFFFLYLQPTVAPFPPVPSWPTWLTTTTSGCC